MLKLRTSSEQPKVCWQPRFSWEEYENWEEAVLLKKTCKNSSVQASKISNEDCQSFASAQPLASAQNAIKFLEDQKIQTNGLIVW